MFIWSDEETALLLKITLEYKTSRLADGQDWETVRSKYEDLYKKFIAAYPNEEEEIEAFPRGQMKCDLTRERVSQKLKKIVAQLV